MKTRRIYTGLVIACMAFLIVECTQNKSDTATESSATGRSETDPVNTDYETPVKLKEYLTGDWVLSSAAAENGNNTSPQRITFSRESTYTRYAGQQQADNGLYRVNEQHQILYLESKQNGDLTEWKVTISSNDQMTLALRDGSDQAESKRFTYQRQ